MTVNGFAETVGCRLARTLLLIFVANSGPQTRLGKIFVDLAERLWDANCIGLVSSREAWTARLRMTVHPNHWERR